MQWSLNALTLKSGTISLSYSRYFVTLIFMSKALLGLISYNECFKVTVLLKKLVYGIKANP